MIDLPPSQNTPRQSSTGVVEGLDIGSRFLRVVNWSRGGSLHIVTPFMKDFNLKGRSVSATIMRIARASTQVYLITAPPDLPWQSCRNPNHAQTGRCPRCDKAAEKVRLLDKYFLFAKEILIKEGLHAKAYVSIGPDGRKVCMMGSVNLTEAAFFRHCELGVYTADANMISDIEKFISRWKKIGRNLPQAQPYRVWRKGFLQDYPRVALLV